MDGVLQFSLFATRDISIGETLWEVMGIMAIDSNGGHTQLSEMIPSPKAYQWMSKNLAKKGKKSSISPRVLCGPIRFANHKCGGSNVEVRSHINDCVTNANN